MGDRRSSNGDVAVFTWAPSSLRVLAQSSGRPVLRARLASFSQVPRSCEEGEASSSSLLLLMLFLVITYVSFNLLFAAAAATATAASVYRRLLQSTVNTPLWPLSSPASHHPAKRESTESHDTRDPVAQIPPLAGKPSPVYTYLLGAK